MKLKKTIIAVVVCAAFACVAYLSFVVIQLGLWAWFDWPSCQTQVVFSGSNVIDRTGIVLTCSPPVKRLKKHSSVEIDIVEKWDVTSQLQEIELSGGKRARIDVVLVGSSGQNYTNVAACRSGNSVDAGFLPPWGCSISEIRIYSSEPVHCTNVNWVNYNGI